ncbi:MAG TPA: hypothetical protein VL053_18635 [Arachidicoccus sp.]|nr:hypothetical protein [Arachidicoccus sp.]
MKNSQLIGALLALMVIFSCFVNWSYIPGLQVHITGMDTAGTHFGKPGILHIFFAVIALVMFSIQKLWSKRTNIFVAAINLAWGVKNFILVSMCSAGDCQEKEWGIYLLLIVSSGMMLMTLLPKINIREDKA